MSATEQFRPKEGACHQVKLLTTHIHRMSLHSLDEANRPADELGRATLFYCLNCPQEEEEVVS